MFNNHRIEGSWRNVFGEAENDKCDEGTSIYNVKQHEVEDVVNIFLKKETKKDNEG